MYNNDDKLVEKKILIHTNVLLIFPKLIKICGLINLRSSFLIVNIIEISWVGIGSRKKNHITT